MKNVRVEAALIDIDNTLLYAAPDGSDVIPDSVVGAIDNTEALGVPVFPVTGRSLSLMGNVHEAVNFRHSGVLDGGASVFDFSTGTYVERRWLPAGLVQEIAYAMREHITLVSCTADYRPLTADQLDPALLREDSPSFFAEYPVEKQQGLYQALGRVAGIHLPEPMFTSRPDIRCVQITLPGVDKFSGVQALLRHERLEGARLLVVGDNRNDRPLFAVAGSNGIKVPMGDAPTELRIEANRPPVGTAKQEGLAYAFRRYVAEPIQYGMDDETLRPAMTPAARDSIRAALKSKELLADPHSMRELTEVFAARATIDPWEAMLHLTRALERPEAYQLLWRDLNILRPASGVEHASAVLGGLEEDYIRFFFSAPEEVRIISRFGAVFGDIGKILTVATTGQNFTQSEDNRRVAARLMQSTDLPPFVKRAVPLLVGHDILGGLLQGHADAVTQLSALREKWPKALAPYLDDMLFALYMSDASAHSAYRSAVNTRTGYLQPAVQPDDAQLTFLFERHPSGALTLTPERCAIIAAHLPDMHFLRHLVVPGTQPEILPYTQPAEVFADIVRRAFNARADDVQVDDVSRAEWVSLTPQTVLHYCPQAERVFLRRYAEDRPSGTGLGALVVSVPEQNGTIQNTLHVRDGRVWLRRIAYRPGDPRPIDMSLSYSLPPTSAHSDEWTEQAMRRVAYARSTTAFSIGVPLGEVDAWQFVRWLEACI